MTSKLLFNVQHNMQEKKSPQTENTIQNAGTQNKNTHPTSKTPKHKSTLIAPLSFLHEQISFTNVTVGNTLKVFSYKTAIMTSRLTLFIPCLVRVLSMCRQIVWVESGGIPVVLTWGTGRPATGTGASSSGIVHGGRWRREGWFS